MPYHIAPCHALPPHAFHQYRDALTTPSPLRPLQSHGASHGPGSRPLHTEGGNAGARASMLRCSTGNYSTSTVASLSYMLQPSPTLGPAQRRVSFALLGSKEGSVHRGEANAHHVVQIGPRPCMDPQQPSTAGALTRLSHLGTDGGLGDGVGIGDYGSKALVYLPQAAIAKRSAANKWLWAKEITVTDLGIYRWVRTLFVITLHYPTCLLFGVCGMVGGAGKGIAEGVCFVCSERARVVPEQHGVVVAAGSRV